MKSIQLSWSNLFVQVCFATTLVFANYNLVGLSFYHLPPTQIHDITPAIVLAGSVLLIGLVICILATLHSLGAIGIALSIALFAKLCWMIIDWGIVSVENIKAAAHNCAKYFVLDTRHQRVLVALELLNDRPN